MTEWQKIAAMLGRVADEPFKWNDDIVSLAITPLLADIIKDNGNIVVAVPENFGEKNSDISLAENKLGKFILAFPDEESAGAAEKNVTVMPAEKIFRTVSSNKDIKGILLAYRSDPENKSFLTSAIIRECVTKALQLGLEYRGKK